MERPPDAQEADDKGPDTAMDEGPSAQGSSKPPTVVDVIMRCLSEAPQDDTEARGWGDDLFKALSKMPKGRDRQGIKLDGRFWSLTRSELLAEFRQAPLVAARGVIRALQCLALTGEEDAVHYVPPVCSLLKLALGYMGCRTIIAEASAEAAAADDDAEEADVVPDLNSVPEEEREMAFSTLLSELDGLVQLGVSLEPTPKADLRCAVAYLAAAGRLARRLPALSSPAALALAACLPTHHDVERAGRLFLLLRPTQADLWPVMLARLCKARQSELAHALVRQSPMTQRRDLAIQHVHTLRDQHSYKAALLVVGTYGLRELFPDARRLFREQDIREKVKKGKFGIIEPLLVQQESRPEELEHCRRYLLKCLMDKGHYAAALKLLQQYGYPDVSIDPALLEAERVERAERYVCLPYPLTRVLMVDSMDSLMLAKQMVDEEKRQAGLSTGLSSGEAGSDGTSPPYIVMGVDVEWTACMRPSRRSWGRKTETADTGATTDNANAEGADEGVVDGEEGEGGEGEATALEDPIPLPSDAPVLEAMEIDDAPLLSSPEKATATEGEEEELNGWDSAPIIEITMELEDVGRVPASADGRPSILQLGFRSGALLCDLYALCGGPAGNLRDTFDEWLRGLMRDCNVIKVGFDVMGDFTTLRRGWPQMGAFYTSSLASILDLMQLRVVIDQIEQLPSKGGLTDLALRYLGKPLDKSEQLGDWNQRPLHEDQMSYAALDAYACVALFDEIRGRLEVKGKDYPLCWTKVLQGDAFGGHYMGQQQSDYLRADADMEEDEMAGEGGAAADSNQEPSSRKGRNRRRGARRSRGEGEKGKVVGAGQGGGRRADG